MLWVRVIRSIHGHNAGFDLGKRFSFKGIWSSIVDSILNLYSRHIISLYSLKKSIDDGRDTFLWKDVWIGNDALEVTYPRFATIDVNVNCLIADRHKYRD